MQNSCQSILASKSAKAWPAVAWYLVLAPWEAWPWWRGGAGGDNLQWNSVRTTWENYLKSQCPAPSNAVMYCAPRSICIRTSLQSPNTKLRPILHSNRDKHIQVFTPPPLSNPAKVLIKIRVGFSSPQLRASKIRIREFGNIGTSNVESYSARHT